MPTKVTNHPNFEKQASRLHRKFPQISKELRILGEQLEADERPGEKIPNVGYDVYKTRLKNPSANKGKSGGFRVVYYVRLVDKVVMLSIYSKSEQTNISPSAIKDLIDELDLDEEE